MSHRRTCLVCEAPITHTFPKLSRSEWRTSAVCWHCRRRFTFRARRRPLNYCGQGCLLAARDARRARQDRYVGSGGYVYVRPARDAAHVAEHVLVAQVYLRRPLEPGEHVRHLDGNRANNDPGNLEVWRKNRKARTSLAELAAGSARTIEFP